MLDLIAEYGMFLAKAITVVVAILLVVAGVLSAGQKNKRGDKGTISVSKLNDKYTEMADMMKESVFSEEEFKILHKEEKKKEKQEKADEKKKIKEKAKVGDDLDADHKKRVYVIDFEGDISASQVESLREEITTILMLVTKKDEVVVRLESPGGMVHAYGLASSQLARITSREIPLTICVDMVAASGGYMMACIANKIIAAPFAVLGSIGVMANIPNVHRVLKKYDIDYDVMTAGEYKRTMTTLGENTEKGREKFQKDLEDTHELFKKHIKDFRPVVDIDKVATGEIWYGQQAIERDLIDEVMTSDDYLMAASDEADIYEVKHEAKKSLQEKLGMAAHSAIDRTISGLLQRAQTDRFPQS